VHVRSARSPRPRASRPRRAARTVAVSTNGRKGPSYDWHALCVPSDAVFEASLQTLLGAHARGREDRYA
jgi:hypothetical protein